MSDVPGGSLMRTQLCGLLFFVSAGCAVHGVHVAGLEVPTPAPIVQRVSEPLYVVVANVPDTPVAGQRGPTLHQLRHFARRPLKQSLATYFETVIVVDSVDHVPTVPHLELHVTVDEIGNNTLTLRPWDKITGRSVPTLTWSAELHGVDLEAPEFAYTGTLEGERPMSFMTSAEPAYESLFGDALVDLTTELVVTGVVQQLRVPTEPAPVEGLSCPTSDEEDEDAVSATM